MSYVSLSIYIYMYTRTGHFSFHGTVWCHKKQLQTTNQTTQMAMAASSENWSGKCGNGHQSEYTAKATQPIRKLVWNYTQHGAKNKRLTNNNKRG